MAEDYASAARRHFRDAEYLEKDDRLDNADQLYGFAAECAIKSALTRLPISRAGLPIKFRQHIDELWELLPLQGMERQHATLVAVLKTTSPFQGWSVDQRYATDGEVCRATLNEHKAAARRVLGSVNMLTK